MLEDALKDVFINVFEKKSGKFTRISLKEKALVFRLRTVDSNYWRQEIDALEQMGFSVERNLYTTCTLKIYEGCYVIVKNYLDLILSEVSENNELAFACFEYLKAYATATK